MQSPVLAVVGMYVCPLSIHLTHAGIVSKRRKLGWEILHRRIAQEVYSLSDIRSSWNSKGFTQARALNENGVGRHISETVQDRTKVAVDHLEYLIALMSST